MVREEVSGLDQLRIVLDWFEELREFAPATQGARPY
jgi:hypothetical protein